MHAQHLIKAGNILLQAGQMGIADARIAHRDIQPPEPGDGGGNAVFHRRLAGHIHRQPQMLRAERCRFRGGSRCIQIGDHHPTPGLRHSGGHRETDAVGSTGDQGDGGVGHAQFFS